MEPSLLKLRSTNLALAAAGILTIGYCSVHVFAGGPEIHVPALQSELDPLVKGVISVIWHAITAVLLLNGLALLWLSRNGRQHALGWMVVVQFISFAGLFIAYGLMRFGDLMLMPQWIGFLVIAGIAALGLRGGSGEASNRGAMN